MTVYNKPKPRATPDAGNAARSPDTTPPDPRFEAFRDFLASVDRKDWRLGQTATRRLRELGLSVCLIKAPDDRRPA
jgi:hypothetical protein